MARGRGRALRGHGPFWIGLVASWLVLLALVPELLLFDEVSLMHESFDRGYVLAFSFINDLAHGGIQLWNRFHQMPYAFLHFQTGYYDLHKLLAGLYFQLFPPGAQVGPDLRLPFLWIFLGFTVLMKTFGLYLLLRRFTRHSLILVIGILYGNTFLSATSYVNLSTVNFLSFLPLLLHLLLQALDRRSLTDLGWALVVLAMCFAFTPYHTLNYLYLLVHFFLLSALLVACWPRREPAAPATRDGAGTLAALRRSGTLLLLETGVILGLFYLAFVGGEWRRGVSAPWSGAFLPWLAAAPTVVAVFLLAHWLFGGYPPRAGRSRLETGGRILLAGGSAVVYLSQTVLRGAPAVLLPGGLAVVAAWLLIRVGRPGEAPAWLGEIRAAGGRLGRRLGRGLAEWRDRNRDRRTFWTLAAAAGLCLVLALPNLLLYRQVLPTMEFDRSRAREKSPLSYFRKPAHLAYGDLRSYPRLAVDHLVPQYDAQTLPVNARSYTLLGSSTLFFACAGVFWGTGRRRLPFGLAYLALLLLNWQIPRWVNPLHWLNAGTNPFAFTNRSFHFVVVALAPLLLAPLVVSGMEALLRRGGAPPTRRRLWAVLGIAGGLALIPALQGAPRALTGHLVLVQLGCLVAVGVAFGSRVPVRWRRVLLPVLCLLLFAGDSRALADYLRDVNGQALGTRVQPVGSRACAMDGLSPAPLPVREFFRRRPFARFRPDGGANQDRFQGMYYQFVDLDRFRQPGDRYFARPRAYAPLAASPLYDAYLNRVDRLFLTIPRAVAGVEDRLAEVLAQGLEGRVVVLDLPPGEAERLGAAGSPICADEDWAACVREVPPPLADPERRERVRLPLAAARRAAPRDPGFVLYSLVAEGVPPYLTTALVTRDAGRFQAWLGDRELTPTQGELIAPYRFDVQNLEPGRVVVSLPPELAARDLALTLEYTPGFQAGVVEVGANTHDRLELVVEAEADAWFVYHSPYDAHWRITRDDRPVPAYRANGAFLAVPLHRGRNRLAFAYRPGSGLRPLLWLSLLTGGGVLAGLVVSTLTRPVPVTEEPIP